MVSSTRRQREAVSVSPALQVDVSQHSGKNFKGNTTTSPTKCSDFNHQAVSPENEMQKGFHKFNAIKLNNLEQKEENTLTGNDKSISKHHVNKGGQGHHNSKQENQASVHVKIVDAMDENDERFGTNIPVRQIPLNVLQGEVSFMDFMSKMFQETKDFGCVRLQPHPDWNPLNIPRKQFESYLSRLAAYKDVYKGLDTQVIKHPIRQEPHGNRGFYSFLLLEQDNLRFSDFEKIAAEEERKEEAIFEARKRRMSRASDKKIDEESKVDIEQHLVDFEEDYWKRVMHHRPLYGADLSGTLFNQSVNWNLNDLNSILDIVSKDIKGVTSSYLYFGMHRSTFAWHIEDMNLPAINYLHFGAGKQWYVIPEWAHEQFESFCRAKLKDEFKHCKEYLRHKTTLISPFLLRQNGIPVYSGVQREGEFIVVWPVAYHCGFNTGFNCAEAVNFAFPEWIPYGERADYCQCTTDSVRFDMKLFKESYKKLCTGEAMLSDFKEIRKMINTGGMSTLEEEPAVSRCSKVTCNINDMRQKKSTKLAPSESALISNPSTEAPPKRKRGRPRKYPLLEEQLISKDDNYNEKQNDAPGSDRDDYDGDDGDTGYNDGGYDGYGDYGDYDDGDGDAGNYGEDGDDDDDKSNDPSFNPNKRKRPNENDSPRKKKKIPRGEMECSIEDCPRSGNRSITSLRNTYTLKPNATGKVCDRHYFSDRRHYMRGTDPNNPTPKKAKKTLPPRAAKYRKESPRNMKSMSGQAQPQNITLHFQPERSSNHDRNAMMPQSTSVFPHVLLDEETDMTNKIRYSEQLRKAPFNMTTPIGCKDEAWKAIAAGADPSFYFFPQQQQILPNQSQQGQFQGPTQSFPQHQPQHHLSRNQVPQNVNPQQIPSQSGFTSAQISQVQPGIPGRSVTSNT